MYWNLAVVRGVYGTIGTSLSIYLLLTTNFESIVTTTTLKTTFCCISHLGFFVFECVAQILFDLKFKTFNKALHGHHVLGRNLFRKYFDYEE
jgi:ceroid-lipofuscinosis protein 8